MKNFFKKKEENSEKQPQIEKDIFNLHLNRATLFDIPINSGSMEDLLKVLTSLASTKNSRKMVFTPNPEFIVKAQKEPEFKKILQSADINLPDGIGLIWASRILKRKNCIDSRFRGNDNCAIIKERISGADMVERLLQYGNEVGSWKWEAGNEVGNGKGWKVGVVGARRGVQSEVEELINRLGEKYPRINFINLDKSSVIARSDVNRTVAIPPELQNPNGIASSQAPRNDIFFNIVFAAHGMQKQEKWITDNKNHINTGIFMGVGGSLDFITGFTKRAPAIWQKLGVEWLWRGLQKPSHFKRVWNAVFVFGFMVLKELIFSYKLQANS